jgi:hypothetical protein
MESRLERGKQNIPCANVQSLFWTVVAVALLSNNQRAQKLPPFEVSRVDEFDNIHT